MIPARASIANTIPAALVARPVPPGGKNSRLVVGAVVVTESFTLLPGVTELEARKQLRPCTGGAEQLMVTGLLNPCTAATAKL